MGLVGFCIVRVDIGCDEPNYATPTGGSMTDVVKMKKVDQLARAATAAERIADAIEELLEMIKEERNGDVPREES